MGRAYNIYIILMQPNQNIIFKHQKRGQTQVGKNNNLYVNIIWIKNNNLLFYFI